MLLLAFLALISLASVANSLNYRVGAVEGYYWPSSEAVNGQSGHYSIDQRLELINLLAAQGAGVYWYAPQSVDTVKPFDASETSAWTRTASLGTSTGVAVVYGLRPGWLDTTTVQRVMAKVDELHAVGIRNYSLNMDDAEGASSDDQKQQQVWLVGNITSSYPDMSPYIFVPSEYWQHHDNSSVTKQQWARSLEIGDNGLPASMAFGVTGPEITPSSMTPSDFPPLTSTNNRRLVFWDNWIALDSAVALPWGLIGNRGASSSLFSDARYGYIVNMAYPLERTIHQIHCLGTLISGGSSCDAATVAGEWAQWLSDNGFAHSHSVANLTTALTEAIEQDNAYTSIAALEAAFPGLKDVFSTSPADVPSATPIAPPTTAATPVAPTPSPVAPSSSSTPAPTSSDVTVFTLPFALIAFVGLILAVTL